MEPTVILYANCQGNAIISFLRKHPALLGHRFVSLRAWMHDQPTAEEIAACRLLAYQTAFDIPSFLGQLPVGAEVVRIPLLSCTVLWPYTFDRPQEAVGWRFPYGDRCLIRMNKVGTTPEEIAKSYLEMDLGDRLTLGRLWELELDKWMLADASSDVPMANYLSNEVLVQRLFFTPDHPTDHLIIRIANRILAYMNLDSLPDPDWATHTHSLQGVDVPVHPSIIGFFKLQYLSPERLYPLFGGHLSLSAADSYKRYVRALREPSFDEALAEATMDIANGACQSALNIAELVRMREPTHPRAIATTAVIMASIGLREHAAQFLRQAFPVRAPQS